MKAYKSLEAIEWRGNNIDKILRELRNRYGKKGCFPKFKLRSSCYEDTKMVDKLIVSNQDNRQLLSIPLFDYLIFWRIVVFLLWERGI